MPRISILTAVLEGRDEYLGETYESLRTQVMPTGWDWEWIVQEDGETGDPRRHLPGDDPRVSYGTGPWGRASQARTLALPRVTGELIRALDADDQLTPGALARDIEVLTTQRVGWVVSPALDLHVDGSVKAGPRDPDAGPVPDRLMYDGEVAGLNPVLGTTATTYTALVQMLGGWPAVPMGEDSALLIALEAIAPGWMQREPSVLYRRWDKQTTAGRDATEAVAHGLEIRISLGRADALRALGVRVTDFNDLHAL
jgi:glycosyltransferase involved in cell wall biosynthesis